MSKYGRFYLWDQPGGAMLEPWIIRIGEAVGCGLDGGTVCRRRCRWESPAPCGGESSFRSMTVPDLMASTMSSEASMEAL